MAKDIHSLIRLKKWTVDEEQRALSHLQEQEAELLRRRAALEDSVRHEQVVAAADPTGLVGRAYGDFAKAAVANRVALDALHARLTSAIAVQRDKIAEAFRETKTLEQIQQNRDRRAALERGRKELAAMDELAAINHRRRQTTE
ncbi:MAG: hypothetical protein JXQ84_04965 [Rhodospirillaceae bacterium]|nr:hypothetical protein [Rhodospirillaceae bacterium]